MVVVVVVAVMLLVVVVAVEVVVGVEVGAVQSKSLQGQPAAQFSLIIFYKLGLFRG